MSDKCPKCGDEKRIEIDGYTGWSCDSGIVEGCFVQAATCRIRQLESTVHELEETVSQVESERNERGRRIFELEAALASAVAEERERAASILKRYAEQKDRDCRRAGGWYVDDGGFLREIAAEIRKGPSDDSQSE